MASLTLRSLIDKLNPLCRRTLDEGAANCLSRTNYNVEIEHWLLKLLEAAGSDVGAIVRHYDVDQARLTRGITAALDRLKTGNARPPQLSPNIIELAREAWLVGSVEFGGHQTRSGHLLFALLSDPTLRRIALEASHEFERVSVERLKEEFGRITASTEEARGERQAAPSRTSAAAEGQAGAGDALDRFTIDLTERARSGAIDPVVGRDKEIRQVIDILTRRRQNNPILTGEAGVGKTAVVEGFALRVAGGDVPEVLRNIAIHVLDLGLLQAGAGVRGEFENRLKSVIDEVKASPVPIVLFIDEAHTLIGAGGQAGQGDAANLLKPALARGELRTIAATTWAEYKEYFETDAALTRRFQVVKVEEPSVHVALDMMRGLVPTLEAHHKVRITHEGLEAAVQLSNRYISGRQLPDKSVSLLDTACARIGLSQSATPPAVEDCQRRIERVHDTLRILHREVASGTDHGEQIERLRQELAATERELEVLRVRWQKEREQVEAIRALQTRLEESAGGENKDAASTDEIARLREELEVAKAALAKLQGERPLVHLCVDSQSVAETVSSWTGIPLGRMVSDEITTVLKLKERLEESIIGQSHALAEISQQIRVSRAALGDPRRPIGVFLLAGPSGVGKTETAITLANLLYGGEQNMTVINMSEYKEEHKVSLLMGSPPGYVGFGKGGVLTEAVRRKPYSVVLLDEMEKAHPGVQEIFYQVFDKGTMMDGTGREVDFKNTIILMTTNEGSQQIMSFCADPETRPEPEAFAKSVYEVLLKSFKPAFLGRLSIIPYYPLTDDVLKTIVRLKLDKIARRMHEQHRAAFGYSDALADHVASRCTEVETGARNVDHILNRTLLPELSLEFLSRMAEGQPVTKVHADVTREKTFRYEFQ
jgi:type VI secretion system protein VasG